MIIFWLVLLILAIVIEVLTMGLTSIWFAGGSLVAILAALLQAPVWFQRPCEDKCGEPCGPAGYRYQRD